MINLLVTSMIMRLKLKINYLNLVNCIGGWFLALSISHLCIKTFDLTKLTNQSWDQNCIIMLYFEFRSHDQFVIHKNDHEIKICNNACLGYDLMIEVSTPWSILLDKVDLMNKLNFTSWLKIQPPDQKFDRLKKLNFDLMKFDLLTPT